MFLNVVEFRMDLQAALDAPLFHTAHFPNSFYPHDAHPASLIVEGRFELQTIDALKALGNDLYSTTTGRWTR